jgi:hypothetical protein
VIASGSRNARSWTARKIPVYGEQEFSAYNGHFESGSVHSAADWEELLPPEMERQPSIGKEVVFRADAAFTKPEI